LDEECYQGAEGREIYFYRIDEWQSSGGVMGRVFKNLGLQTCHFILDNVGKLHSSDTFCNITMGGRADSMSTRLVVHLQVMRPYQ
jgi:hypothetical protein